MKFSIRTFLIFSSLIYSVSAIAYEEKSLNKNSQRENQETNLEISEDEVSPNEDLMREHGVLSRLLLIYQEIVRRIDNHESFSIETLSESAKIVRHFIENYHEKLEEDYVFPKFEKAHELVNLIKTLNDQHEAGRHLTDYILTHSSEEELKDEIQRMILADYMRLYIRIFRPHVAREDTILFPAFRKLLSKDEYMKLGEIFEEKEHSLFGKDGFKNIIRKVTDIEKQLNIFNLSAFTPELNKEN